MKQMENIMIISHKYKYVFIKTRKTAGTSIQASLRRYCGDHDIASTLSPIPNDYIPLNHNPKLGAHVKSHKIKKYLGHEWKNYFTFAFERNPWDKTVSSFWWNFKEKGDFNSWCKRKDFPTDFNSYSEDDKVIVNSIFRYENLIEDLYRVCEKLSIPWDGKLTKEKGDSRKSEKHYRDYYNDESIELVRQEFSREIELFGYEF